MRTRTIRYVGLAYYHEDWRIKAHNQLGVCIKIHRMNGEMGEPVREYYPSPGLVKMLTKWLPCFVETCDFTQMDFRGGTRVTIRRKV